MPEFSIKNDNANVPDVKGALGEILVEQALQDQDAIFTDQLSETRKVGLTRAISLLTEAWDAIKQTDLRDLRHSWIAQRSLAKKMLSDLDGAITDMDAALGIAPSNLVYLKHRAILAYEKRDSAKAIEFLKQIPDAQKAPEVSFLLASILASQGEKEEAIKVARGLAESNPPPPLDEDSQRLLIKLYIDDNALEQAQEVSSGMRAQDPTNVSNLVDAAQISRASGDVPGALSLLNEAQKYITDQLPFRHIQALADELYDLEQFADAVRLYERIADTTLNSPLTRQLLRCYYQSGEAGQALEICRALHQRYGPLEDITEMESVLYEEIGDLTSALKVAEEYLEHFPDDSEMKLRKAVINYRAGNEENLDDFLKEDIELSHLSLAPSIQLAQLHSIRGNDKTAIDIMYKTRRRFFNESEAISST